MLCWWHPGTDDEDHLQNLAEVLSRLQLHGIWIEKSKCHFMEASVLNWFRRLHATADKVEAMMLAPIPKNGQEVHSFQGLLNYYWKLFSNLASLLQSVNSLVQPLNSLLQQGCKWKWTSECTKAFKASKDLILSAKVLAHYDPMVS